MQGVSVAVVILCGFFTLALSWILNRTIHEVLVQNMQTVEEKWFPTTCCHCGKEIEVKLRTDWLFRNPYYLRGNACYECVPEKSILRNGYDESAFDVRVLS